MATIDWSQYTSDGDPNKGVNRSSDRFPQYLKELLIDINKIKAIRDNFGKSSITSLCSSLYLALYSDYSRERISYYENAQCIQK